MAVIIAGMQAAIGSCNSLEQYERSLYSTDPCPGGPGQTPAQVALSALQDADSHQLSSFRTDGFAIFSRTPTKPISINKSKRRF